MHLIKQVNCSNALYSKTSTYVDLLWSSVVSDRLRTLVCDWMSFSDFGQLGRWDFFRAHSASLHFHSSLLTIVPYFFVLFKFCCSRAQVSGRTFVHEFHFFIAILNGACSSKKNQPHDMRLHGITLKLQ